MGLKKRTSRFSGADWADELREITLIGAGGIGSWLALNLSRIGHSLTIWDGDNVDTTNVHGGQMYQTNQIGKSKVAACYDNCRAFGTVAPIDAIAAMFTEEDGVDSICMTGLDNMTARKIAFRAWRDTVAGGEDQNRKHALFMDGRLLMEFMEILTIPGDREDLMDEYEREFLFSDSEVEDLDCTTKQSTFSAMTISGLMTATLCNFLTNRALGFEVRDVPFHQKFFLPIFKQECISIIPTTIVSSTNSEPQLEVVS